MPEFSPLATPGKTREILTRYGLNTKKSLGQHFLVSDGVIGRILRLAKVSRGDQILEIGPGIGTLTEALLLADATVFSVEKDFSLLPVLADIQARYPRQFCYLHADALDVLATDDSPLREATKLVANLPYAVAATLVLECFVRLSCLQSATVMVQSEVAQRMMAKPNSKDYGAYTIKLQSLALPIDSFKVSASNFLPPPRVNSTVLHLQRNSGDTNSYVGKENGNDSFCKSELFLTGNHSASTADISHDIYLRQQMQQALFTIVDAAFFQRRKTVRNSMLAYVNANINNSDNAIIRALNLQVIDSIFKQAQISPVCRGESIPVAGYQKLAHLFVRLLAC
ncbi:MAG: 16S rRNA (adenine(1518)-N(6)/adenine(1519)-N(6))-dimethyltransferase RsmA [Coriobacteriales bacterium]|jgi:16S rRNA (adenine1518-N6/adenine1519-N6)-dimethyltransferase|nr:16S rRNA (adenine(1518)-N(6)/adenine(1519)-N(6))-dimethyltransferase RsmA [Coriobacteriales bacterium]